jgi:hypothetical protein
MLAIDRLGLNADFIKTIARYALFETSDGAVCSFWLVGSDNVVQRDAIKAIRFSMNLVDLRLLAKATAE